MTDIAERPARPVRRRTAADRRAQLVQIGLRLLMETPIHELPIDRVAEAAGISRGLLFHYFATKSDFYLAVVEAATERLLDDLKDPADGTGDDRLRVLTGGIIGFVHRRTSSYVALVRGYAGADQRVAAVLDSARTELSARILTAVGIQRPTPWQMLIARGWIAMTEEMAIASAGTSIDRDQLLDHVLEHLYAALNLREELSCPPSA